jgi:glycosyltransferase involved in cell wall biosynthesis
VLRIPRHYSETAPPPNPPTISLVTPSFNGADFLSRTLDSVLGQKYPALEYVVQDGGSTDGTVAILERYGRDLHRWVSRPDRGQAHAVNLGFEGTTGEIMGYLNSDDVLLPGSLAYVAQFFAEHAEADVVYGHRVIIDAHDGEIGRWVLPPHDDRVLSWADFIPQETMFWRRRVWDRVGGVDESFRFALDWDLILRFRDAKARFVRLPRFLGGFRFHAQQKTLLQLRTIGECEMQRLRHRCHGTAVGLVEVRHAIRWYLIRSAVFQHLYALGLYRC